MMFSHQTQGLEPKHNNSNILVNMMNHYHTHDHLTPNQCTSSHVQKIVAPLGLVWSVVRQFGNPQAYKQFIQSCTMSSGDGGMGSVREVNIISGLPAKSSTERLDRLDDDLHIMVFSIIGGDHRLRNYQSTTTLHVADDGDDEEYGNTVVVESYVVDVPADSCKDDTCCFADSIIGFNLTSLAKITEKMAREVLPWSKLYPGW